MDMYLLGYTYLVQGNSAKMPEGIKVITLLTFYLHKYI